MKAVSLTELSKTYPGGKQAVKGISLTLQPGELFGFLGPNGAGKTTTVKLLTGMLSPSSGSCLVYGMDPSQSLSQVHALSGVVTEHAQMYDRLTGLQNLSFYGSLFGLSSSEGLSRARSLLDQLGLADAADQKLQSYSTGMRQRLSLARALLHRPKVLFLDEPTSGLDPGSAKMVNQLISRLAREEGVTIFLCTHQLRYAQEICTRYGLIEAGRLLDFGTLHELRRRICPGITLTLTARHLPSDFSFRIDGIPSPLTLVSTADDPDQYELAIDSEDDIPAAARAIVQAGGDIYRLEAKHPSLEDIYFTLTTTGKEASL